MSSAPVVTRLPGSRTASRKLVIGVGSLGLLFVIVLGGLLSAPSLSGGAQPSPLALEDIPADFLGAYEHAAARYGIDWAILAAIGKVECDHGRSRLAGCSPPGTVNGAGATGPMQFLGSTWRRGTLPMAVPAVGRPTSTTADGYASDGDGDGFADAWNPADAIAGAARLLRANGAPANYDQAIFAYNHAAWYVRKVLEIAARYRAVASVASSVPVGSPGASVAAVLGNPRIQLTGIQRVDLATGLIDLRVVALLAWLGRSHTLVVTALRSDHSLYTSEERVSNHALGRAVDVGAVDGEACTGARSGACGRLAVALASVTGPLRSRELIYCFDPDGPLGPAFARADHCGHIHVGYES